MNATPNVLKKKPSLKLSRKDQLKRNPIPWILLFIVCGGLIYFLLPDYSSWNEKKAEIKTLEPQNIKLQENKESLQDELAIVEAEFNEKAGDFLVKEKQIFPEKITPSTVAQIIEIYSILLQRNSASTSEMDLKSLNIGKSTIVPGKSYAETQISASFLADEATFKKFIKFMQSGEISDELRNKVVNRRNKGDAASIEFLDNNRLPISNIRSVNVSENKSDFEGGAPTYNIQMQLVVFSQAT